MAYLRNVWYVAAWASQLTQGQLLARQLLDEPVVMFRDAAGQPRALFNRCPHRFAPLSMGKLCEGGNRIQCGYHGLQFDSEGRCVHNPHGNGHVPATALVKHYPMAERWSLLWIWMGDAALATPETIPELPFLNTEDWYVGEQFMEINTNYQLENDNILDLSHIDYLHPGTLASQKPGIAETTVTEEGLSVWSRRIIRNEVLPPFLYQATGIANGELCDRWLDVRWDAPATMYLNANIGLAGHPRDETRDAPQMHIFTPASHHKTYYFFSFSTPKAMGPMGEQIAKGMAASLRAPFVDEDKPMVEAVHVNMGNQNFWELKPISLPVDAPALRVRRVLDKRIAAEQAQTPT